MQARIGVTLHGQSGVLWTACAFGHRAATPDHVWRATIWSRVSERGEFNGFLKSPNSVIGHLDTVELCPAEASVFHFEPELAVVIGKRRSPHFARRGAGRVFGYTQFIDGSSREAARRLFPWANRGTPWPHGAVSGDQMEVPNANALPVKLWVNDELRHDFSTAVDVTATSPKCWPN
ncbi:MAG: fumarylacetoacetate hydrolase family protein [Caldilineaceae bacterium]